MILLAPLPPVPGTQRITRCGTQTLCWHWFFTRFNNLNEERLQPMGVWKYYNGNGEWVADSPTFLDHLTLILDKDHEVI